MAVIGTEKGLCGLLGLVHDGGHPILILVEDGRYMLLTALFHQPNPHHLAPAVAHTVVGGDFGDGGTAAPAGFRDGDLLLVLGKLPPVVGRLLPAAGDL